MADGDSQHKDFIDRLRDSDGSFAEAWLPKDEGVGALLHGRVMSLSMGTAEWKGKKSRVPVVTIDSVDHGEPRAFWAYAAIARRKLKELRVAVNDHIGIKYLGKGETRGGQPLQLFEIVVDGKEPTFSWDDVDAEDGDGPAAPKMDPKQFYADDDLEFDDDDGDELPV